MRVAHVYKDVWPPVHGGIERYISDVAAATAARGFTVEVHVGGSRRSRTDRLANGVTVHRHGEVARVVSSPIAPGLPLAAKRIDADVVHLHMPNPIGEIGALFNRDAGALVATFHAPVVRQRILEPLYGPLRDRVLRRCRAVLVSSEQMSAASELKRHSDRVQVLTYGVPPSFTAPLEAAGMAERSGRDGLRLLFVGRLVYYKGLDVLLRAVSLLPVGSVTLTVVGSGPLRAQLDALVADLGLEDRVELAGWVDDRTLREMYRRNDAFVLPSSSRAETFGLAMSEAMASGLPAVSTSVGTGTDWVNLDGVTGLVVPPRDAERLASALHRLATETGLRERLGRAARERALSVFSFDQHLDGLVAVYQSAVGYR